MGKKTGIAWTDSTFNPWEGCSNVSPGCELCYAETRDCRFTGGRHWGPKASRRVMSEANWKKPHAWNRQAQKTGIRRRVFSGSLCDVFDNQAPAGLRERLWQTIRDTPLLDWQLLTKRAPNIEKHLPEDWGAGYPNVWLGVTVENRRHGLPRIEILREIPVALRFLSCEPLLEYLGELNLDSIGWVIVGGEKDPRGRARPMEREWVEDILAQCNAQAVPRFFKQWGGKTHGGCELRGEEVKEWPLVKHSGYLTPRNSPESNVREQNVNKKAGFRAYRGEQT